MHGKYLRVILSTSLQTLDGESSAPFGKSRHRSRYMEVFNNTNFN